MKKVAIISIVVCVISLALTGGLLMKKLNNDDAKKDKTEKVVAKTEEKKKTEKKETEDKKSETKKEEKKDKKEEKKSGTTAEKTAEKTSGKKAPNFEGKDQVEVYEFAQKHNINYALGKAVPTSKYDLRGKVASQSIKPGDIIPKDQELILQIYVYIEHYDQVKKQDRLSNEV